MLGYIANFHGWDRVNLSPIQGQKLSPDCAHSSCCL